jgi:hypothetical protein
MLRCVCNERKRRFATPGPPFTHCKRGVCLFVCSSQTFVDCGQGPPQRGAGRGATAFYTSSVDVWCSLGPNGALNGPNGGAQGTMGRPNQPGQRAQDLQGRLTVSEGHGYPLICKKTQPLLRPFACLHLRSQMRSWDLKFLPSFSTNFRVGIIFLFFWGGIVFIFESCFCP